MIGRALFGAWLIGTVWYLWRNRSDLHALDGAGWCIMLSLAIFWPITRYLEWRAGR